jgi:hypothetical protein
LRVDAARRLATTGTHLDAAKPHVIETTGH